MKILTTWLRSYLPDLPVSDAQLAEDLTLRGIAVEGVFDLAPQHGAGAPSASNAGSFFEMDITTNRVDAMNHYGIAREAATIYGLALKPLDTALPAARAAAIPYPVRVEDDARALCGRLTVRVLRGIAIQPSGGVVAERFRMLEQKFISNAVDATNYVTQAIGQPTHAFDLDKVAGGIVVRRARKGERLRTLDGAERVLDPDDLVIADEEKALSIAGVMGGSESMITPGTTNVLVEAAWFEPATIRRSSKRHGLHTDASHRFERGADFNAAPVASALVARILLESGGFIEGEFLDIIQPEAEGRTAKRGSVGISLREVRRILGPTDSLEGITAADVELILGGLGCSLAPDSPVESSEDEQAVATVTDAVTDVGEAHESEPQVLRYAQDDTFAKAGWADTGGRGKVGQAGAGEARQGDAGEEREGEQQVLRYAQDDTFAKAGRADTGGRGKRGQAEGGEARQGDAGEVREGQQQILRYAQDDTVAGAGGAVLVEGGRQRQGEAGEAGEPGRGQFWQQYAVTLPSWRLDLEREIDLIEEVARIYGYNRFLNTLPAFAGTVRQLPHTAAEQATRQMLLASGLSEAVSSTFCSATDAVTFSAQPGSAAAIENPLSEEAGMLRPSLLPGMLTMLAGNLHRDVGDIALFEMGTVFSGSGTGDRAKDPTGARVNDRTNDRVDERPSLAIGLAGRLGERAADFYVLKGLIERTAACFAARSRYYDCFPASSGLMPTWLHPGRSARLVMDGSTIGYFGQLHPEEAARRKLKTPVYVGELRLDRLYAQGLRHPMPRELSRFQAVRRDFSFLLPEATEYAQVDQAVRALALNELVSFVPGEILRAGEHAQVPAGELSLLLKTTFQSHDRTLKEEELQSFADQLVSAVEGIGGRLRS